MSKHPWAPRREALHQWLTANGVDADNVPLDSDLWISADGGERTLHYELLVTDAYGNHVLDERREYAAREKRTTPLIVDPPDWWEPHIKPTREQLLAVLERVRERVAPEAARGSVWDGNVKAFAEDVLELLPPTDRPQESPG